MLQTDNYDLNIVQGTDIVNPLVVDNPNYQKIDKIMKDNEIRGIGTATELKTGSIHAITVPAQYTTFKFVATSDFIAGETFTLNGKQVTGYTTNQQTLATNAYRIGATVLCSYIDRTSTLTLYTIAPAGKAEDSAALDGHPASYFAVRGNTNQTLEQVNTTATARGILAQDALNAIKWVTLWTNNNVGDFNEQTIDINAQPYSWFLVTYIQFATSTYSYITHIVPKGRSVSPLMTLGSNLQLAYRNIYNLSNNSITFSHCYKFIPGTTQQTVEDGWLIPYSITAIK